MIFKEFHLANVYGTKAKKLEMCIYFMNHTGKKVYCGGCQIDIE